MKRITACLLGVLLLVLSACGTASPAAEPTASPAPTAETTATPEPTLSPEPTPATTGAAVCVLKAPAILALLEKDAAVTVEEVQDGFYLVSSDAGRGLVEKRLLVPEVPERMRSGRVMRKAARSFGRTIISAVRCCAPSP